jgi:transcriptional/translational regulatory protein YebC/TACO1
MGADDVEQYNDGDETLTIYTDTNDVDKVRQALEKNKYKVVKAETTMVPKTKVDISDEKTAHQVMRMVEKLEDLDDVQDVYTNADFSEEFAESYGS